MDLFEARGSRPNSLDSAMERTQDFMFSSQSLHTLEAYRREHRLRHMLRSAWSQAAKSAQRSAEWEGVAREVREGEIEVVLLAYRPPAHELGAKMIDFSAASLAERWAAGRDDMRAAVGTLEANVRRQRNLI